MTVTFVYSSVMGGIPVVECKSPPAERRLSRPSSSLDGAWAGGPESGLRVRGVSWDPYVSWYSQESSRIQFVHIQPPWWGRGRWSRIWGRQCCPIQIWRKRRNGAKIRELKQYIRRLRRMTCILLGQKSTMGHVEDWSPFLSPSPPPPP